MAYKQLTDRINKKLKTQEGDRGCFVEVLDTTSPRVYSLGIESRLDNGELVAAAFTIAGMLSYQEQTKLKNELIAQLDGLNKETQTSNMQDLPSES